MAERSTGTEPPSPGWWLAPDGDWYPPPGDGGAASSSPGPTTRHRRRVVAAVVLVVIVVVAVAAANHKPKPTSVSSAPRAPTTSAAEAVTGTAPAAGAPGPLATSPPSTLVRTTTPAPPAPTAKVAAPVAPDGAPVPVPDPVLTPGAVFPGITAATVCTPGYASSVRDVPSSERAQVFARYHEPDVPNTYEVDHLISLELGGSNDITNLWPEPLAGPYGAHVKDSVENALHSAVCAGSMLLAEAQHVIATAWWTLLPWGDVAPTTQAPTAPPAGGQATTVLTPAPPAPPATSTVPVATAGSFCAVVGDTAVTRAGTPLVCATASKSGAPYTQPRWRTP